MGTGDPRAAYEQLRAAHLNAVRASLEDHVARLAWPRERIARYRTERLRALLGFARERSPFHAARMAGLDPATATVEDLPRLPPMLKDEAQDNRDAIVTRTDIDRAGAERVLAGQPWFSYTPAGRARGRRAAARQHTAVRRGDRARRRIADVSTVTAALTARLLPYGLANPGITVRVVDRIPRHASTGKLKRFVALCR